jgi:hypothetical protein
LLIKLTQNDICKEGGEEIVRESERGETNEGAVLQEEERRSVSQKGWK